MNHDETPFQLCLALQPGRADWRAIVDPGIEAACPETRYDLARRALAETVTETSGESCLADIETVLAHSGPDSCLPVPEYGLGVFWIGAEVLGPGRAIYIDASPRPATDSWARATSSFLKISAQPGGIETTLKVLATMAAPASVGLEVRGTHRRLKVHTRLIGQPPAARLARVLPMLSDPAVLRATAALMQGSRGLSFNGFVIETAIDGSTGLTCDGKMDFALPELWPPRIAFQKARAAAERLGVMWPAATIKALEEFARLAFVGIGRSLAGTPRLNLYLKPDTPL